ncbi:MAG: dnaB [Phycisphaerales bacterium]|nr:dnaB [Phycisphaerales bacterium]
MSAANFVTAADAMDGWRDDVLSGRPPTLYPLGTGPLARIEVGPGLVTLLGGAPGAGKTAFTMQCVVDALRLTPALRILVCNTEMPPGVLLDRQLARLSGIDLTDIRYRRLGAAHADRVDRGIATLADVADRLAFVRPPFDLGNVAAAADAVGADLVVLAYIQRIAPPGQHADRRGSVDACMSHLRRFADAGTAVVVVSAVGRSKDGQGRNSYAGEGLNLASFRESSELEFGADDAFILAPDPDAVEDAIVLKHLKARNGEALDLRLSFDRRRQQFTAAAAAADPVAAGRRRKLSSTLAGLWDRTPAAAAAAGEEDA